MRTRLPVALASLAASACALFTQREHVPATFACDTEADVILVTVEDNGGASFGSCELGLPDSDPTRVELTRQFDPEALALWSGVIDPSTGLSCRDIEQIEGDCTLVTPGK